MPDGSTTRHSVRARFRAWLTARRAFHSYSAMNVLWIVSQCPHATHVAGFRTWRDRLGYQVRKGERGMRSPCR